MSSLALCSLASVIACGGRDGENPEASAGGDTNAPPPSDPGGANADAGPVFRRQDAGADAAHAADATTTDGGLVGWHVPPTGGLAAGACAPVLTGCTLTTSTGGNPVIEARAVYDGYFGPRRPKTIADFDFKPAPWLASTLANVAVPQLPAGRTKDEYKAWISLTPDPWRVIEHRKALATPSYVEAAVLPFVRTDARSNEVIFAGLQAAGQLTGATPYERQNSGDWLSAAVTHYAVPSTPYDDIMATNFVWRILGERYRMEQGLADCNADPNIPCVDSIAALSDVDMGRVYDVRFIRTPSPGVYEISKVVRVIAVDSGHTIATQATQPAYPTNGGTGPRAPWRFEIGGQMAQQLNAGSGAIAALARWASSNGKTPAVTPATGSCTDLNDGEWKCIAQDGATKTVKCMDMSWQVYTSGCHIPGVN